MQFVASCRELLVPVVLYLRFVKIKAQSHYKRKTQKLEPDIAEGSGLRNIEGNCELHKSYISNFIKLKLRLHYG